MTEIKAIEKVLSSRHEKPKSEKHKRALSSRHKKSKENTPIKTKKGTYYKDTKYKQVQRLFINSPIETDVLLKEVFGYDYIPEEDVFNIIVKNYGVNEFKKKIKNIERRIEEKNKVIKIKPSTTIKRKRKTPKKSSEQNRKNKDSNKVKIKKEKDIKNDDRIKSKKLKNKLKGMPIY